MTPEEATQALFKAATTDDVNLAREALAAGTSVNATNDRQRTPLHNAAKEL